MLFLLSLLVYVLSKPAPCVENSGCSSGSWCSFTPGTCPIPFVDGNVTNPSQFWGTCQPVPVSCPNLYSPVCGCDLKTYHNFCWVAFGNTSVLHAGECQSTSASCSSDKDCAPTPMNFPWNGQHNFCRSKVGHCKSKFGVCSQVLNGTACKSDNLRSHPPVCGCSRISYKSICECYSNSDSVQRFGGGQCTF